MTRKPKWKLSDEQVTCLALADEMLMNLDDWRYELLRVGLLTDEARGKLAEMELLVRQYEEHVGVRTGVTV